MRFIDTHTHVWSAFSPLCEPRRYTPPYSKTMKMLFNEMQGSGVERAVLVQPSFLGTDNQYLLSMLELWPERLRGVVVVEPGISEEDFSHMVDTGVAGVRLNLVGHPAPESILSGSHDSLFNLLNRYGCHLEIQMPGQAWPSLLKPLLARGLTVVADHFGLPETGDCPGNQALMDGLRSEQLWIKLSGAYRFNADPKPLAQRFADTALDRLLWGSDYPWTQHEAGRTYQACLKQLNEWIGADSEQVLTTNASNCFGF